MNRLTLAYSVAICAWTAGAFAEETGPAIAERVRQLRADTPWRAVRQIPLQFDAFHSQGMAIVEGRIFVSSVEVIDRAKGEGRGHVFEVGPDGNCMRRSAIEAGASYHAGGLDYDGHWLWVPFAEYRPGSHSIVFRMDTSLQLATPVFTFNDHLGLVVHDAARGLLIGATWGSRNFYRWKDSSFPGPSEAQELPASATPNRAHYIDLQDGQWLEGTTLMLCGGLKNYRGPQGNFSLGGLELIEMESLVAVHQVPVPLWEPGGRPMLQNAFAAEPAGEGLRFYFLPADGRATIHIYEPELTKK